MSDFAHAPLTKALDIAVLVAHAFWRNSGPASYPNYTDGRASLAWRLLTGNLVLVQTSEVFFGLLLIYQFRFLERRMGTAKYAAFVAFALVVGWALRLYLLHSRIADTIASGPYSFMFACFPLLLREIPGCRTFQLGPFALSDRPFYYITGLQLALSSAPQGWAALCGLAAGTLYLLFGRRAFSVPGPIARLVGGIVLPILSPAPTLTNRQQLLAERQRAAQQAAAAQGGAAAAAADGQGLRRRGHHYEDTLLPEGHGGAAPGAGINTDLSSFTRARAHTHTGCLLTQAAVVVAAAALREEDIAQLQAICSRGRIDVIAALQRTGGNVEAAANALLSQER